MRIHEKLQKYLLSLLNHMQYELILRSRPDMQDPVAHCHDRIMSQLQQLPPPWGLIRKVWPKIPEEFPRKTMTLRGKSFSAGIVLTVSFRYRDALRDDASCDDF